MEEGTGIALGVGCRSLAGDRGPAHRGHDVAALQRRARRAPRPRARCGSRRARRRGPPGAASRGTRGSSAHGSADASTGTLTDDDVTLLAVAVGRASLPGHRLDPAACRPPAPGVARRFIRTTLTGWAVTRTPSTPPSLRVGGLVTNAVIHTGTAAELTVPAGRRGADRRRCGTAAAKARSGPSRSTNRSPSPGADSAWSRRSATAWSAERSADGPAVWFELEGAAGATAGRAVPTGAAGAPGPSAAMS